MRQSYWLGRCGVFVGQDQAGVVVRDGVEDVLVDNHEHQVAVLQSETETLGQIFIGFTSFCPHKNDFFVTALQYLKNVLKQLLKDRLQVESNPEVLDSKLNLKLKLTGRKSRLSHSNARCKNELYKCCLDAGLHL